MVLSLILLALIWMLPLHGSMICEQRQQSQMLKFIASLMVVIGHQTVFYTSVPNILVRETGIGALCVAFFLFMSGYGLFYSFVKKRQVLDGKWLYNRLAKLIVPALAAMLLYVIAEICVGKEVDYMNQLKYGFISDINLRYGWFVTEILILYIAFWICFRFCGKYGFTAMVSAVVVSTILMAAVNSPVWFVQGLPCFLFGMLLAKANLKESFVGCKYLSYLNIKWWMTVLVIFLFCMKNFSDIQSVIPMLNKWRYMYLSYFLGDIVFVGIISYVLMRLPVCHAMENRGGTSMRFTSCKEQPCWYAVK